MSPRMVSVQLPSTSSGGITHDAGGAWRGGKTSYSSSAAGFFMGYSGSAYKFKVGNATYSMDWDGSGLTITGDITGVGNISITGTAEFEGSTTVGGIPAAVHANSSRASYHGVVGWASNTAGAAGVVGFASGVAGARTGAWGSSESGTGVLGNATTGVAVQGTATSAGGVGGQFAASSSSGVAVDVVTGYVREPSGNYSTGTATPTLSNNKPGSNSSSEWVVHYKGATKGWIPWFPDT